MTNITSEEAEHTATLNLEDWLHRIAEGLITTPRLTHSLAESVCIDVLHHPSSFLKKNHLFHVAVVLCR